MPENIQQAIPLILLAIAFLVVAWVMIRSSRKTKIIDKQEGDVLDEGAKAAARNQALIDSEPAATQDTGIAVDSAITEEPASTIETTPKEPANEPAEDETQEPSSPATPASTDNPSDDLKRIKGLGPKLVKILAEQGITSFSQIAAWTDADIERVDATLGRFAGRIARDQWVEQAKLLAAEDADGFAKAFGNNS